MLQLKNIKKTFGNNIILKDINLEIKDGEFLVLLGPSGCGKTTLVRIIAGLEQADSGIIVNQGREIQELAPKDRKLSMVFQNYALYPHKTVYENLAFPLKIAGKTPTQIAPVVQELAAKLGLVEYLERKPKELSGGQRQRVALARAMAKKPSIFLLDEPLSNLDAKLRSQMRQELFNLHKQSGATFIYVTHDQIEALSLADKIVVMNHGEIQQTGSPAEIYSQPANIFVASFIGSPPTNILELEGQRIGIRPEFFRLRADTDKYKQLDVLIRNMEILGNEVLVYCDYQSQSLIAKFSIQDFKLEPSEIKKTFQNNSVLPLFYNSDMVYYF